MPKIKQYEYLITTSGTSTEPIQEIADLKEKGFEGWELINIIQVGFEIKYYWKRELLKTKEPKND
jgi:hypothetical protein